MVAKVSHESFRTMIVLGLILSVMSPMSALAQEDYPEDISEGTGQEPLAEPDEGQEGLELFRQAQERYDEGRYQEAVGYLLQLLELDPDAADIYYNIALAYEHLNDYERALYYLDQYRELDIGDDERQRVERMMTRIRGAQANAPPDPEPETHTRVVVQRFGRADAAFWAMVASTVFFAGGAAVTGGFALNWSNAADRFVLGPDGDQEEYDRWVHVANSLAIATDVFIGVASATAITALLLYVLRTHEEVEERGDSVPEGDSADSWGDGDDIDETSSVSLGRAERPRRLIPRVQVGVGAVIMGWDL